MPRKLARCPFGGHHFQVQIEEGHTSAKAIPQGGNLEGPHGHNQVCPICNRMLFIKYIPSVLA